MINLFIGYDPRESLGYSVCVNSIIRHTTSPLAITPLSLKNLSDIYTENHTDGSTEFTYTRFLIPYLMNYTGWAIFMDSDIVTTTDINELWQCSKQHSDKAIICVHHDYKTKAGSKFFGSANRDFYRKNWSSVMLINCAHPKNRVLTPKMINSSTGAELHQFTWLDDNDIGSLPIEWNWLVDEFGANDKAKIIHYSLGTPFLEEYKNTPMADVWFKEQALLNDTGLSQ